MEKKIVSFQVLNLNQTIWIDFNVKWIKYNIYIDILNRVQKLNEHKLKQNKCEEKRLVHIPCGIWYT